MQYCNKNILARIDTICECLKMFTALYYFKISIMLKQVLNLEGAQKLSKDEQLKVNGSRGLCPATCSYVGQRCYSQGHCGCPGSCVDYGFGPFCTNFQ